MAVSCINGLPLSVYAEKTESELTDELDTDGMTAPVELYADSLEWDLTAIADEIGYDETVFQSADGVYEYEGLTITGKDANASISSDGIRYTKANKDDGTMNITYTPEYNGTLYVTARIGKDGSSYGDIYVDNEFYAKENSVTTGTTENEVVTGSIELSAGTTYYIYNGNRGPAWIQKLVYQISESGGQQPEASEDVPESETEPAVSEDVPETVTETAEEPERRPLNDYSVELPPIGDYEPDYVFFEDYQDNEPTDSDAGVTGDLGGWIARNSNVIKLTEDPDGNRYINMAHSASGGRGAYKLINLDVDQIESYTMSFDAKFKNGNKGSSQFALGAADYLIKPVEDEEGRDPLDMKRYDYNKGMETNYIFMLEGEADSTTWVMNPGSDNIPLDLPESEFLHFELTGNVDTNQLYVRITNGDETIYDGQLTPCSDMGAPQMLYMLGGRNNPDIGLDNIDFKAYYSMEPIGAYKTEDEVGISVAPFDTGKAVYLAAYDEGGDLVSVDMAEGDGTAKTLKAPNVENGSLRLYKWGADMKPLASSKVIEADKIQPAESATMQDMRYAYHDAEVSLDGTTEYKDVMPYRYWLPEGYDSTKEYPVVIYLHGAGARGEDNKGQIRNDKFIVNTLLSEEYINNPDTQCIIIAPQIPAYDETSCRYIQRNWGAGSYNYNDVTAYEYVKHVHDVIVDVVEKYNGDTDRIYISGQSMGGYGAWYLAATYPEMFAAIVGLCGAGPIDAEGAGRMAEQNMAAWAFHGDEDGTVPTEGSEEMIEALKSFGATNAHLTIMPGFGHDIQEEVFTGSGKQMGLYEWLFAQSRTKNLENKGGETEPDPTYPPEQPEEPTHEPTPDPTEQATEAPQDNADLYAVYTLDGTADGEISRVKVLSAAAGDTVSVPAQALGARKFTDINGLYDIYTCVSGGEDEITLNEGDNEVYITVKHEDGKYYAWEDFESYAPGDIPEDNQWYHGWSSTVSSFINCTTDNANTSTAARWYASNTSGSREKTFTVYNGIPEVPEGEKLVFSADFRMSATRTSAGTTKLSFGNGTDEIFNMSVSNSITSTVNGDTELIPPSVSGTSEETGGDGTAFSKWLNLKVTIDPAQTENNTVVELTSLTDGDKFTVNGDETDGYSYTMTSTVAAVTQMTAELCRGYRGAVVVDNIKLYNTQSEYLEPAKNELQQAIAIYGAVDKSLYTDRNMSEYDSAVTNAASVLADSGASNRTAKEATAVLINAASGLELKSEQVGERTVINEDPDWIFIKEKNYQSEVSEIPSAAPDKLSLSGWSGVDVPHTWNAYDGSDDVDGYDACKSWYRKSMYIDAALEGKQIYLEFDGASIRTELYVNGVHVPFSYDDPFGTADENGVEYEHKGAFDTFRFDITDYVRYGESNVVAVSVDNRIQADTLPLSGDYTKEGGMYRDVSLIAVDPVHVDMLDYGSAGLYLTPEKKTDVYDDTNKDFTLTADATIVNDSETTQNVRIEAALWEPDHYDVPDNEYIKEHLRFDPADMYTPGGLEVQKFETVETTIDAGESYDYSETIEVLSPKLWDGLESPYRYEVRFNVYVDDELTETITETVGFRYFRAPNPTGINSGGSFYLNGRLYPIEGVGKHQDWGRMEDALGIATTQAEMLSDVAMIYELGANGVRLVHYQHSLDEVELYDKLGITVYSEPALCSAMTNANAEAYPAFEKATLYQLEAMIKQQYNKPSVLFWGFSNEITHEWDDNLKQIASEEKKFTSAPALFKKMQDRAKELDPVRLTTYAANTRKHEGDLYTDITGSNIYPYWYVQRSAAQVARNDYDSLQKWITTGEDKPISVSEYGGSAIVGNTYEYNEDGSVEFIGTDKESNTTYQAYLHEKAYQEFCDSASAYWGKYVWQMFDSASDGKTDGSIGGINTKGLVSYDHKTKKDAYYFYKANWNDFEPFAFIVNASRIERPDPTTIIRAYTNMDLAQLYVNGQKYGEPITDTNENDAVADGVHVFMWYDVPLADGGNTIEVRGIKDGEEICTTLDTNGEVVFTSVVDGVSMKSNDTSVMTVDGDTAELQCMASEAPEIADITGGELVTVLAGSNVSVTMPDGTPAADGRLKEGMKIRVTDAEGSYKDYTVTVDDLAAGAEITVSDGSGSVLNNGNTAAALSVGAGQSVVIRLDAEYTLNGMDMYFDTAAPYTIEVSSDGKDYTAVKTVDTVSEAQVSDSFDAGTTGQYIRLTFGGDAQISEVNVYGWRFINNANYEFDGNDLYLGTSSTEHDTDGVFANLLIIGQASYDFELQEAGRVLSEGDILRVTEKHGATVDYTLHMGDK